MTSFLQTYSFTAFSEADLLKAGDHSLSCGDKFTMPSASSVCITVKDDDKYLSGDARCNENADDRSYQTAAIADANGAELGNGGQVYAEKYRWVSDQHGNWYVLIEIEQEGTGDDYFAFFTGGCYTVPPAGAHLTVHGACDVRGDWLKFDDLDSGPKPEPEPATGSICGAVFCDTNCDGIDGIDMIEPGHDYVIEAEHMIRSHEMKVFHGSQATGGAGVKLKCAGDDGWLKTTFNGKTGVYDVTIRVQDENDGRSVIKLLVDGKLVEAVRLDRDNNGGGSDNGGFSHFVIRNVSINQHSKIKLVVDGDKGEFVRIDNIQFEGQDKIVRTPEPPKEGVTVFLLNADGTNVLDANGQPVQTVTDAEGKYEFTNVPVGDYRVKFVAPDGTVFTKQNAGSDDTLDSDVNDAGVSDIFTVAKDEKTCDIDAGVKHAPGSVEGRFFFDADGDDTEWNSTTGAWEAGVAGAEVRLIDSSGAVVASTTADASGGYQFSNVAPGDYRVKFFSPEGFEFVRKDVGDPGRDSDADAEGVTDLFHVSAGAHLRDIDAGIATPQVPDAVDDVIRVMESEGAGDIEALEGGALSVLANDVAAGGGSYAGQVVEVNGVAGLVGAWVELEKGRVLINADGTVDFDADGDFDALNDGESETVTVEYTISEASEPDGKLNYKFWNHVPSGHTIHNIPTTGGEFTGTVDDFDVNALALALTNDPDTYKITYTGFIKIEAAGDYALTVGGDDGVGIWIDGHLVASRDGLHAFETATGHINLSAGVHTVEIRFFENYGDQGLAVHAAGPDTQGLSVSLLDLVSSAYPSTRSDTATVSIIVEGESDIQLDAVDDVIRVMESEGAGDTETLEGGALSVLANDVAAGGGSYAGQVAEVNGVAGLVGAWIELEKGRVLINADGTVDFDADGDFDALNAGESETISLTYTITAVETEPPSYQCLDFNHLARGTIVTTQFASAGLTVTSGTPGKQVMIFDTANPTGGDWDLRTTNLGKALIISEDGDSSDPDDNAGGGTFIFTFDRPATITSLTFLDTEEPVPQMRFYDENGALITTIMGPVTADNGQGVAHFNVAGAARMEVQLRGSGAIDNLVYTLPGAETVIAEDTATVTIIVEGVDDPNAPPVAAADFIAIDEDGAIAPDAETALNVLENDSDPEGGPLVVSSVVGGAVGAAMNVTTANGVEISVTLDANGDLRFDTAGLFDDLAVGEADSFTLTYTAMDDAGLEASATVTVVIDGLNEPPVAADDAITIGEADSVGAGGAFALNLLANDSDPNEDALLVSAVEGVALDGASAVATVTTASGRVVDVTIAADGAVTFETAGAFDDLNDGESDSLTLAYTVSDGNGGTDDATLTITINGEGSVAPAVSYNVIFLVDASASLVGTSGAGATIIGSSGPLDLNGDGIVNSEYDAALLTVQKITDKFAALGLSDVEIGVATFDSELQAVPSAAVRLADASGATVFGAGANLASAFAGSGGDGFAFYDTAIAAANGFFAATTGNDGGTTVNLVYLLTDGTGFPGALGAELATLATFGATLDALVVDDTAAGSPIVFAMESAAGDGVASVLDSELAVSAYIAALGDTLIA